MLLAVPNFSEGRDEATIGAIAGAFGSDAAVLDLHSDPVHNRSVVTLGPGAADAASRKGPREEFVASLLTGAAACVERIDMRGHDGAHPCIGALDVCPLVWTTPADRDGAREAALEAARGIAGLEVPVFLYGELATDADRGERAFFRRGGLAELSRRVAAGELAPDFGPAVAHPSAGATLVTARPPLAAFNLVLDTGDVEVARAVAAGLRESGGGLAGVRAIGVDLDGRAQVSTNVHDPTATPLAAVIERTRALAAEHGARPVAGELVGLVPEAGVHDLPGDLDLGDFDPSRQVIERRLEGAWGAGPH